MDFTARKELRISARLSKAPYHTARLYLFMTLFVPYSCVSVHYATSIRGNVPEADKIRRMLLFLQSFTNPQLCGH